MVASDLVLWARGLLQEKRLKQVGGTGGGLACVDH